MISGERELMILGGRILMTSYFDKVKEFFYKYHNANTYHLIDCVYSYDGAIKFQYKLEIHPDIQIVRKDENGNYFYLCLIVDRISKLARWCLLNKVSVVFDSDEIINLEDGNTETERNGIEQ